MNRFLLALADGPPPQRSKDPDLDLPVDGMVYENSRTCNDGPILYMQEVLV